MDAAAFLGQQMMYPADVVVQCGSGMAQLPRELLTGERRVEIGAIPNCPVAGVAGHGREAVYGLANGLRVMVFTGRVHLYEGYSALDAAFPAALAKALGAKLFIAANAAGGLEADLHAGEFMVHNGFINFQHDNPLAHLRTENCQERFVDPRPPYDPWCSRVLASHLVDTGAEAHRGVYIGVLGPAYETLAELHMLQRLGADAVGMSCIPEVLMCHFFKLPVVGVSIIANHCFNRETLTHDEVVQVAGNTVPLLSAALRRFLADPAVHKHLAGKTEHETR